MLEKYILQREDAVEQIAQHLRDHDRWIVQINPFNTMNEVRPLAKLNGFQAYLDVGMETVFRIDMIEFVEFASEHLSPHLATLVTLPKTVLAGELSVAINQDVKAGGTQDVILPYDPVLDMASWSRLFLDAMEKVSPETVAMIKKNEVKP